MPRGWCLASRGSVVSLISTSPPALTLRNRRHQGPACVRWRGRSLAYSHEQVEIGQHLITQLASCLRLPLRQAAQDILEVAADGSKLVALYNLRRQLPANCSQAGGRPTLSIVCHTEHCASAFLPCTTCGSSSSSRLMP